ncbi:Rrf2 family transcriptional regulator [Candidatus Bealeia paramacronuclearis]|uniref:Rrf2 family transcriptional regulator n=1 Tax=Candidatus Bealeia paramacronuclearis TaxID=1921001 RepID=A0ABZ2C2D8_9PROT|nr:Rrf2 family transcriptional regulator [Candidatus Bealeia paramacronuclearis]
MKIGTKERYAVMALIDLAHHARDEKPVSISDVASRQSISIPYLEQVFVKLRRKGFVKSQRGQAGGYYLSRPPAEIRISDILEAMDASLQATRCSFGSGEGCLHDKGRCMTHDLWEGLSETMHNYLKNITLLDVVEGQLPHQKSCAKKSCDQRTVAWMA